MVRVRNSCSLPASSSLAGAELRVMRLGVQRMGGEMAERLAHAVRR